MDALPTAPVPPPRPLPLWLRLMDAAAVVLVLLAAWQVLTGGARGGILRFVVPPDASAVLLSYAAVALLLVRHLARPAPSSFARVRQGWQRLGDSAVWGPAWRPFLATRPTILLVAFFAVTTLGMGPNPGFRLSDDVLTNLPARFDAGWYGGIAMNGYEWEGTLERQSDAAFFPAMPLLMRAVGNALGARDRERPREIRMARLLWAGVLISLTAFFFALVYLVKLGTLWIGEERSPSAAWLLACYPFAFAYCAPYTESLLLLSTVGAAYHFGRRDWTRAGAWGLLAGLSRPNGFLLAVPLGLVAGQQLWHARRAGDAGWLRRGIAPLATAGAPAAGMLMFTTYLFALTDVWFAWSRSHVAWGRSFGGLAPLQAAWSSLSAEGFIGVAQRSPFDMLNALGLVFALVMIGPVYRKVGGPWAIYVLVSVAAPLLAGGVLSMGRLTSTLFPLFLTLAAILPSRAVPGWAAAFAMLQGLCAALFFTWRQLY